jgi:hypothetical protein
MAGPADPVPGQGGRGVAGAEAAGESPRRTALVRLGGCGGVGSRPGHSGGAAGRVCLGVREPDGGRPAGEAAIEGWPIGNCWAGRGDGAAGRGDGAAADLKRSTGAAGGRPAVAGSCEGLS